VDGAGQPLVLADPAFVLEESSQVGTESKTRLARELSEGEVRFDPLPGTRDEGLQVAALLGVRPWLGPEVLESRLKACCSPRLLHLATHGFFLDDRPGPASKGPLLRSGLALAGAQSFLQRRTLPAEAEDGLLTALDVMGMNLVATELVVLSACDTGRGEARSGDGVFGLRRAFAVAGARTLVMSLWSVPDEQTGELMVDFYRRALCGTPRAAALRQAQLALRERHPDPYFWGAFICQGDPGPLDSRAVD
jgi:CHAT domain-containing protein